MYAVIKTGGKQYRVAKNDVIVVERLAGLAGDKIELDQVLMLDDGKAPTLGTPLVEGARVAATVLDQSRGDKIIVFKKKRRKNYRRTMGHRQELTVLRITEILAKGKKTKVTRARTKADDGSPVVEPTESVVEGIASASTAPAAEEGPKAVTRKRVPRTKKAKADASAEENVTKPKRKRVAKPNVPENDSSTAGEPEEKS